MPSSSVLAEDTALAAAAAEDKAAQAANAIAGWFGASPGFSTTHAVTTYAQYEGTPKAQALANQAIATGGGTQVIDQAAADTIAQTVASGGLAPFSLGLEQVGNAVASAASGLEVNALQALLPLLLVVGGLVVALVYYRKQIGETVGVAAAARGLALP